jgi:hypothetical protein
VAEAAKEADIIMVVALDTKQRAIYEQHIAPNLEPGSLKRPLPKRTFSECGIYSASTEKQNKFCTPVE